MRITFVTNICPHYRVKTFETLAAYFDTDFYFFSAGDEWYWQQKHGVQTGNFRSKYLPGFRLKGTRITPTLPWQLWRENYEVYIKCINGRFALPFTFLVSRLRRKPLILWTGIWMRLQTPAHRLFFPITRYFYRHAEAIVVYGEHTKRYLISEGVPAERIFVASHAVENEVYSQPVSEEEKLGLRQKLGLSTEQKVILYLGRLEEVKGLPFLLEAFAALPTDDAVLVLAGTGSEEEQLKQMAQALGVGDRVRFPGYVPASEALKFYSLAWVFVLPSITLADSKELWGLVINEAFNQGLPVITTDAVGAAAGGFVKDGVNGYIVPERDSQALSKTLSLILENSELRQDLSRNARKIVAGWDNELMVKGFRDAVDYVMGQSED